MQTSLITLIPDVQKKGFPKVSLSFDPFIKELRKQAENTDCLKGRFFTHVVNSYEQSGEPVNIENPASLELHREMLQLLFNSVTPMIDDEDTHLWALCSPDISRIFYGTNGFYKLLNEIAVYKNKQQVAINFPDAEPDHVYKSEIRFFYSVILEKLYNLPSLLNREMVHGIPDTETGLTKFYKVAIDARFIEVESLAPLPDLSLLNIQGKHHSESELLPRLRELLPMQNFHFTGVGITVVTDISGQYAIENLKNAILNSTAQEKFLCFSDVVSPLKNVVGSSDIEFGVFPILQVNGKLVFREGSCQNSRMMNLDHDGDIEQLYMEFAHEYVKNPRPIFISDIEAESEELHQFRDLLMKCGVRSYALLPIYYNHQLVGVLEVFTLNDKRLKEAHLSKLEPAITLIAQLLKNYSDDFNSSIDKVIRERFTSLQPSVQWKFKEVAWNYIQENDAGNVSEIGEVYFDRVFPLYGAIDIRNSTVERATALHKDLRVLFSVLKSVLVKLKEQMRFALLDEKIFLVESWLKRVQDEPFLNHETELNYFLEHNIHSFLKKLVSGSPGFSELIGEYFEAIDERNGAAYHNRRQLETSMKTIISSVNNYLELMKGEIQEAFPVYFEKFRTDGVEYDIYIGQSIAPEKPYSEIYLKNLRLMQLTSMSAIARQSDAVSKQLSHPIQTTQLIFIHSNPIDIKFRKDEKRFDVEGAYNIRYHIVKKRIDKVNIRGTSERLTQPGKIALVYFSQSEADEYITYINFLQKQGILQDDLEHLELEELQGIYGLKALRVGVVIPELSIKESSFSEVEYEPAQIHS